MNERIKLLADNATHYANGTCDADPNADWYAIRDQKFAELIVRECFDEIVKGVPLAGFARDRVLNHFGVEE
jgi:hypothetical protein